jgi:histidine ammonia-lyase
VRNILAIELMCAAQGLDFRLPLKPGRGALDAHRKVRRLIGELESDRVLSPDIEILSAAIARGSFTGDGND